MLPTRLNLLLPTKKKYLKRMIYVQFIKSLLETLLVTICISSIIILGGRWILQEHFNSLIENITSISNQHIGTNKIIIDINKTLNETEEIQEKYILWTPIIADFVNSIPEDITLSSIDMDKEKKIFTISGTAENRESLLNFQQTLENLPSIANAPIPISQLTTKESISFSINANLK